MPLMGLYHSVWGDVLMSKHPPRKLTIVSTSHRLLMKVLRVLEEATDEEVDATILTIGDSPIIGTTPQIASDAPC